MPRPKKDRLIEAPPEFRRFKPAGVRSSTLQQQAITLDELEAVRLADYKGMDHAEAAEHMDISRSTFTRLIEKARHKIAVFLHEGKELVIEGGDIHFKGNRLRCNQCGYRAVISIETAVDFCPVCGSGNIKDYARSHGHGNCCRGKNRHKRR